MVRIPRLLFLVISILISQVSLAQVQLTSDHTNVNTLMTQAVLFKDEANVLAVTDSMKLDEAKVKLAQLQPTDIKSINGYKGTKVWIFLPVINQTSFTNFILRYTYPSMQQIHFYLFDDNKLISSLSSGKLIPFHQRPMKDTDYEFPFVLDKNQSYHILMSFESSGSMQLPIEILSTNQLHELTQNKYLFYGIYYGIILLILIYSAFLSVTLREKIYTSYLAYLVAVVFAQMGLHGISYRYFWPNMPEWNKVSTIFFVPLMFSFLSIFTVNSLDLKKRVPMAYNILLGFAAFSFSISISALFAYGSTIIRITGLITSLLPFIIIPPAIIAWKRKVEFAPYYLSAVLFYIVGASLYGLKDSGIIPSNFITENGILLGSLLEILIFSVGIAVHIQKIQKQADSLKLDLEKSKVLSEVASQISHDIRSPLSALNMVSGSLFEIPEEKRLIIRNASQRINDIANQLLTKSKESQKTTAVKLQKCHVELLSGIVDVLVSEKRTQFRDKLGILIELELNRGYGVFAEIDPIELKRAVSNLVNNSVEAFENTKGLVTVGVTQDDSSAIIYVRDNGKGIPAHILKKLGQQRISFGKEGTDSGSGLGIYHARKMIESVGGNFRIESQPGQGTTIYLEFKKSVAPKWFVEKLVLKKASNVVCIDDNISIHQIWKDRLDSLKAKNIDVSLVNISSGGALADWISSSESQLENSLFLVDFELLGQSVTGLDLIEKYKLQSKAILVTSRFEEIGIQNRCSRLGIKLIPKGLAGLVPIELEQQRVNYDACLIDDDPLVRLTWEFAAKDAGSKILTFESFDIFEGNAQSISRDTPISVDVNLANGILGTDVALKLHKMGFKWIYLATGYEVEGVPSCVVAVRGKDPVFTRTTNKNNTQLSNLEVQV
jgi:signal transduction histidine kinase